MKCRFLQRCHLRWDDTSLTHYHFPLTPNPIDAWILSRVNLLDAHPLRPISVNNMKSGQCEYRYSLEACINYRIGSDRIGTDIEPISVPWEFDCVTGSDQVGSEQILNECTFIQRLHELPDRIGTVWITHRTGSHIGTDTHTAEFNSK